MTAALTVGWPTAANPLGSCDGSSGPAEWKVLRVPSPLRTVVIENGGALRRGALPRRQGDKLVARVDAASDVALMRTMDLHDIGDPALAGARAEYREIASLYGHDAFLIEWEQVEFCGERSYREPVTAMRSVAQARKLSSARARLT